MDPLIKKLLDAPGISGYESEVAGIMKHELKKSCDEVIIDKFGNVIARKGNGKKKVMLAAHMDEIGLAIKHITKEGFINFVKVGGIDDRILLGQNVIIKTKKGDVKGIIGAKPPHLQREEDRKMVVKHEDMYIDIGASSKEEALKKVNISDQIVFEIKSGALNGNLCYGKAIDDRIGCYVLLKVMEKLKVNATVYAVGTAQEEVGLKGARTSSFRINPDFAVAIDTAAAGDTPGISERDSSLKLGGGVALVLMEASGRGAIVSEKVKRLILDTADKNKIKYQCTISEGGMTDGAIIYMNREGVPTAIISVPTRYIHAPVGVFNLKDVDASISLTAAIVKNSIDLF